MASPPSQHDPVASLGKWLFVPDRRNFAGDVRTGYLSCNGERVVLQHCSRLLADFVRTIRQLEEDFAARCGVDSVKVRCHV
ncbi:hypothetical protein ACFC1R_13815 [Kitasatospora sp. NPDC056138]|uniref:hypothetical protein n=1 Tax=Kitasatospora sp. NPDC056138 TaxID=3345724 RepID=UPI0035D7D491